MEFYSGGQANSISGAMEMDGFGLMILKADAQLIAGNCALVAVEEHFYCDQKKAASWPPFFLQLRE